MTGTHNNLLVLTLAAALAVAGGVFAPVQAEIPVMRPATRAFDVSQAAVDAAVGQIMAQVSPLALTPGLSVGGFLDATGGRDVLAGKVAEAPRPGGVRQLGAQTAQVRIEVSGEFLLAAMVEIARDRADRSPVPAELIATQGAALRGRQFMATGTVTTAAASLSRESGTASPVDQVEAARADAVDTVLARLTAAGVLQGDDAKLQAARRYLQTCPVQKVVTVPGGKLNVELAIVTDDLIAAMNGSRSESLRDAVRQAALANNANTVVVQHVGTETQAMIPAPLWVDDAFVSTIRHKERLSRLALVRAAEREAANELRSQMLERLTRTGTSFGLSHTDIAKVVDQGMAATQTVSVEFVSEDEVVVVVSVQGRKVWDAMQKVAVERR